MKWAARFFVCASVGLACLARGQSPPADALCPPCLHDQVLQSLPASVEGIIAVNNAAQQRASAAGRALGAALEASGTWAETFRAWEVLARTLEWTPARTFDELLGRRVSLVMRNLSGADGPEWVVVTAVTAQTQERLRAKLQAAPRGAVAGLTVLSIEDGSFQLLVAPEGAGEDGAIVLLGPRRSEALLDEVAPSLTRRSMPLPAAKEKACDVVMAVRPAGSAERSLSITATSSATGWDATVVCEPRFVLERDREIGKIPAWRDSLFKSLEPGSVLAVMSSAGMDDLAFLPEYLKSWKRLLGELTGGDGAGRTGVFVRALGPEPSAPEPMRAVQVRRGVEGGARRDGGGGRLAVTLLCESSDAKGTLVKGDQAMTRLARMIMTGEADGGGGQIQFEVPVSGPRALVLGDTLPVHAAVQPPITRAFGEEPVLSWTMVDRHDGTAWWVAALGPDERVTSREQRALAGKESGELRKRLSIGSVHPRLLARWVDAIEPGTLDLGAARFVESIRWDSWLREDGRIGATVSIRMTPPTGR